MLTNRLKLRSKLHQRTSVPLRSLTDLDDEVFEFDQKHGASVVGRAIESAELEETLAE
jgi:hypothetical protein